MDFLEFNTFGAYCGEKTPIFCHRVEEGWKLKKIKELTLNFMSSISLTEIILSIFTFTCIYLATKDIINRITEFHK